MDSVVKLLSQQFTNPSVQAASVTPTAASSTSATASLVSADMRSNDVWALNGAEKCLDFLINAVCCKGECWCEGVSAGVRAGVSAGVRAGVSLV